MDKVAKNILNALRCPICGSQIDLIKWYNPNRKGSNFGCVYEPNHYGIYFVHWEGSPRIEQETVIVYYNGCAYEITQDHYFNGLKVNHTQIHIRAIDKEFRIIDDGTFKTYSNDTILFNFAKTNRENIIKRIKTILIFQ